MITIRSARDDDAAALAKLTEELGYSGSPEELRYRLAALRERGKNQVFVACNEQDEAIGWISVTTVFTLESAPRAELAGLVVSEQHRSAGIGLALLQKAEAWAREQGLDLLRVRTNSKRLRTHGFYEKNGYTLKKEQRVYEKPLAQP